MARWHGGLFSVLEELGIGFVAFSSLVNGFLSGKYGKDTVIAITACGNRTAGVAVNQETEAESL